jgi:hypothetical protein
VRTKRAIARELMELVKAAYVAIDATEPTGDDWDAVAQVIGRYDGLRQAYELLTGRSPQDVAAEVVSWYIETPEYQAAKANYPSAGSPS